MTIKKVFTKKVEVTEPVVEEVVVEAVPHIEIPDITTVVLPCYDGVQVVKVLEERGNFRRCAMANETVVDVPIHLFN